MSSSLSEPALGLLSGDSRLPVGHHHPAPPGDLRGGSDPRGGDLVSRLLAATPPYLYSFAPPNTFFFSEMLRSFVHAKQPQLVDGPGVGAVLGCAPTLSHHRRPRKRSWREPASHVHQPHGGLSPASAHPSDKPLELTTHRSAPQPPQLPPAVPPTPPGPSPSIQPSSDDKAPTSPTQATSSSHAPLANLLPPSDPPLPSDLLLPPSQPLWYPPLYPLPGHQQPYGFDPLHFFIDLRVSGHILDRNKPGAKEEPDDPKVKHTKHCSAFSVPQPRTHSSDHLDHNHRLLPPTSTNYVMQNLSRIYEGVRIRQDRPSSPRRTPSPSLSPPPSPEKHDSNNNGEEESKPVLVECDKTEEAETNEKNEEDMTEEERAAKKAKDLRALIGLELVVDYVNHNEDGRSSKRKRCSSEDEGVDAEASPERSPVSSVSSKSRSPSPSPPPPASAPSSPLPQPAPSPYLGHGQSMYHDFHHLPSVFLREHTDALNLQVRHH